MRGCNSRFSVSRATLAALAALGALAAPASAQVRVDGRGGLGSEVVIDVPSFRSLTPEISLAYHSSGAPGLAGAGWSLRAGSRITRTSATGGIAHLDATDRFWLDGQELVPCVAGSTSPSCTTAVLGFGRSTGFYSTRVESFRRIQLESGTWTVWERDGTRSTYGTDDGGNSYLLHSVLDTFDNEVAYAWSCASGCELDVVRYGAGSEVHFFREERADPWREQTALGGVFHDERLRSIAVYNGGELLRAYRLSYGTSLETGASILASVQQFGRDATVDPGGEITAGPTAPLPARTFESASLGAAGRWSLAAETSAPALLDVSAPLSLPLAPRYAGPYPNVWADVEFDSHGGSGDAFPSTNGYLVGDFDGDGRAEIATWGLHDACTNVALLSFPTDGSAALPPPIASPLLSVGATATCVYGETATRAFAADVNGDGADDALIAVGSELRSFVARGSGTFRAGAVSAWSWPTGGCVVADVDGDGRDDLICEQPSAHQVVTRRSSPTRWLTTVVATNVLGTPFLPDHTDLTLAAGDVDGDGLADVILARRSSVSLTRVVLGRSLGDGTYDWSEEQSFGFSGELQPADVDGDGKLDLVFSRGSVSSALEVALARKGSGSGRWRSIPTQYTPLAKLAFADVDGDGRADLVGRGSGGADLQVQRAIGDGAFGTVEANLASCDWGSGVFDTVPADWNGDGMADPTCITDIGDGAYRVTERPAQPSGTDRYRWQRADIDGDGRFELVYVAFRNPGFIVHVVSPQTNTRVSFPLSAAARVGLREPDASRWVLADVGSPTGPADGRDDLVLVEHVAGRLWTTTLLATGLGTFTVVQFDAGAAAGASTLGWFAAQDDHDGRSALMRTTAGASTLPGMRVELLRPIGAGQFAWSSRTYFGGGSVAPMTDRSVRGFKPADVDGDGLTDLVDVDAAPGASVVVRALSADGAGRFVEAATTLAASSFTGPRGVRVGDLDGDGAADLYHVARIGASAPCLRVTHYAGDGRGGFAPGTFSGGACFATYDPLYARLFEDAASVVAVDLDGDGRSELLHITHALDSTGLKRLIVSSLRRDLSGSLPQWRVDTYQPSLAYDLGDAWSWAPYRDPLSGDAGLAYVHPQVSVLMRWQRVRDELTTARNGLGLVSTVSYGPLVGARAYLPAGYVPRVVTAVETRDTAAMPETVDRVTYGYLGGTWSDEQGRLLGFTTTSSNDGRQVRYARFAIGAACGAQLIQDEIRSPSGAAWSFGTTQYVAPGAAAPYRCLIAATTTSDCELSATCRTVSARAVAYDAYGNTLQEILTADQAQPSLVYVPVTVNAPLYVIDRPTGRVTYGFDGATWRIMAAQSFAYDGQPATAAPIQGAVTTLAVRDDQTGTMPTTTFTYDAHGNLFETISPERRVTTITMDPTYERYPEAVCNAQHCERQDWDPVFGKPRSTTDQARETTTYAYDAHARLIRTDFPDRGFATMDYLDAGTVTGVVTGRQRVRSERSDGSRNDGVLWSESFYDGTGRTFRTTREGGATTTTTFADGSSRPSAISEIHDAAGPPSLWTTFDYDGIGRLLTTTLPDTNTRRASYAIGERVTTDERGVSQTIHTDGRGRTLDLTDALGSTTSYWYDALGRLIVVADALGHEDLFAWSSRNLQTSTTDPDRGTRSYTYTPDGQLASSSDAAGQTRTWSYDALGRLDRRVDRDSAGTDIRTVALTYDDGSAPHGASLGRLVRVDDRQASAELVDERWYDPAGRVERTIRCVDRTCMEEAVTYDLAGRVGTLHYPDASGRLGGATPEDVVHTYDDAGRLETVGAYATLGYRQDDLLDTIEAGNRVNTRFSYLAERLWLEVMEVSGPSGGVATLKYEHDEVGRIIHQGASGALSAELDYHYDDLGRLTRVDSSDVARQEQMAYDEIGRVRWLPYFGDFHYDDPTHVHAMTSTDRGARRRHDANGNVTGLADPSGRELKLRWTVDDRLSDVDDLQTGEGYGFVYDFEGRRVKKSDRAGATLYFGTHLEVEPSGRLVKSYMAGDLLVARDVGGTLSYFHQDVGHNVRLVTDGNARVVEQYEYRAFGALHQSGGGLDNDITFAGARVDADLGLTLMGARTYDAAIGQFLSADSVIPSLARPQSLNRYSYVENDPINHWDPSGHMRMLIELRKARIAEAPYLPSWEEATARETGLGWVDFHAGDPGWTYDANGNLAYEMYWQTPVARPTHDDASSDHSGSAAPGSDHEGTSAGSASSDSTADHESDASVGSGGSATGSVPGMLLATLQGANPSGDEATDINDSLLDRQKTNLQLGWVASAWWAALQADAASTWVFWKTTSTFIANPVAGSTSMYFGPGAGAVFSNLSRVAAAFWGGFLAGTYAFKAESYLLQNAWDSPYLRLLAESPPMRGLHFYRDIPAPVYDAWHEYVDKP